MSSPENPPIDERFDGLVSELRAARPVAPDDLRQRVAAIAARPPAPPRKLRVTWVLAPAAAALAAGAVAVGVLSSGDEQPQQQAVRAARRARDQGFGRERARSAHGAAGGAREARAALFGGDHASRQGSVRRSPRTLCGRQGLLVATSARWTTAKAAGRGRRASSSAFRSAEYRPRSSASPSSARSSTSTCRCETCSPGSTGDLHASPSCGGSFQRSQETIWPLLRPSSRRCRPRRPGTGARRASRRCRST